MMKSIGEQKGPAMDDERAERAEAALENEAIVNRELRAEIDRLRRVICVHCESLGLTETQINFILHPNN